MEALLEGIKVLDFTSNIAGPTIAAMIADYGGEVIKIERPCFGDDCRGYGSWLDQTSLSHLTGNRGKKSVVMDLKDQEALNIIKKMIIDFDIVVESYRPGIMAKFGLDYDSLVKVKPDLIYCSLTAFGQKGPYAKKPGYDIIAQALSGFMHVTGESNGPPMKHGIAIADFWGGLAGFSAVVLALFHRNRTGKGQYIDVSLLRNLVHFNNYIDRLTIGEVVNRKGNHHSGLSPYGVFNGKNGQSIVIAAVNPAMWSNLCKVIKREDLIDHPDYITVHQRCKIQQKVIEIIENWLKKFDNIDDALKKLEEGDVSCCKVNTTEDILKDPHIKEMGWIIEVETSDDVHSYNKFITRGPHVEFKQNPGIIKKAPILGQHNYEVLESYGLTKEKIDKLQSKWAEKIKIRTK